MEENNLKDGLYFNQQTLCYEMWVKGKVLWTMTEELYKQKGLFFESRVSKEL